MLKTDNNVLKALALVTQIGISMIVPIFLCAWCGRWLDHQFHQKVYFYILLVLGIIAAFRNIYVMTKQFYAEDKKKEDEELKYFASLRETRQDNKNIK